MKMNKATGILKHILEVLTTMAKTKTLALKGRTRALKARFVIFFLLRNKKIMMMNSLSHKINSLIHKTEHEDEESNHHTTTDKFKTVDAVYNLNNNACVPYSSVPLFDAHPQLDHYEAEESGNLEEFEALEDPGGSSSAILDLVKHDKEDEGGELRLEDEVDILADLFIKRFRSQMRMQKQLSLRESDYEIE